MQTQRVKFKFNGKRYPVRLDWDHDRGIVDISFGFFMGLKDEIKQSMDVKWMGFNKSEPRKVWRAEINQRNLFRLAYFMEENPYEKYDKPLQKWALTSQLKRTLDGLGYDLYDHQKEMASHMYYRNYTIIAGEMGVGKTLSALELMQRVINEHKIVNPWMEIWYVGPKSGCSAVNREIKKWGYTFAPRVLTYEGLVKALREWNHPAPRVLVCDESSKIKSPGAKRSGAVMHLATAIREEHGDQGYVTLMSGTPSPKSPTDWWNQCEIACPGFVRERDIHTFKNRLSIVEMRESPMTGGTYPHLVAWKDTDTICDTCGMDADHMNHKNMMFDPIMMTDVINNNYHKFTPCENEVAKLFRRMMGLVIVKFKSECLDLPEKRYEVIRVKPSAETIRAAKLIKKTSPRAVTALTRLRSLSDGFQYTEEACGKEECPVCMGHGHTQAPVAKEQVTVTTEVTEEQYTIEDVICPRCGGAGDVTKYKRGKADTHCPKDDALLELLDATEEDGRAVIWGGFTGTIEKVIELCHKHGWSTLRYDKVVAGSAPDGTMLDPEELLDAMDASHPRRKELRAKYDKIAFVGHPKAGGMALTLTAASWACYYSNDFSGEGRIQSEDRIHRAGMDKNRGCTIYDIVHLATDQLVIDNLKKKRELQALTLGELDEALNDIETN
jgi:SNF2 family DNA or RNA helicase